MLGLPDEIFLDILLSEFEPFNILPFRRVLCPIYQQLPYTINGCISRFVSTGEVSLTLL